MRELELGLSIFGVIFVAELPDKTALAALVLATKYRPLPVFLGAAIALAIQSAVAVGAGSLFALLPARPVHIGAGVVFLVSALLMWKKRTDDEEPPSVGSERSLSTAHFWKTLASVFGVVFLAEWGDLTQLATAAFAAREHAPWLVFWAATLALWAVTAIAVVVGRRTANVFAPEVTKRVAALLFAAIGLALLTGLL
ncbi:MAG TPA: TMEM165/GDT1 family protein [Polyangiaceae bacterium]|jgi:putative Ca2+/H+ antiporter (TMEM165/GDT1 family)|nr:TMEM165/GDT1 family protein [Polyangiaceae bacterium]